VESIYRGLDSVDVTCVRFKRDFITYSGSHNLRDHYGVYLIGNTDTYSNIPMWAKVLGILQATDLVGKALGLCYPRYPNTEIQVRQPDNFARLSPKEDANLRATGVFPGVVIAARRGITLKVYTKSSPVPSHVNASISRITMDIRKQYAAKTTVFV
jgi:hypothetical protein